MALLSEVARTGRKFRRVSEPTKWYWLEGKEMLFQVDENRRACIPIDAEMICSTDWESEPKTMNITSQDLIDCAKTLSNNPICHQRKLAPVEFMKLVIKELGLED